MVSLIHWLEIDCMVVENIVNSSRGIFRNDLIVSDVHSLSKDNGGGFCRFVICSRSGSVLNIIFYKIIYFIIGKFLTYCRKQFIILMNFIFFLKKKKRKKGKLS